MLCMLSGAIPSTWALAFSFVEEYSDSICDNMSFIFPAKTGCANYRCTFQFFPVIYLLVFLNDDWPFVSCGCTVMCLSPPWAVVFIAKVTVIYEPGGADNDFAITAAL